MSTDDTNLSHRTAVGFFLILAVLCACSTPRPTITPLALLLRLPTPTSGGKPAPTPPPRMAVLEHTEQSEETLELREQSDRSAEPSKLTTPPTPQLSVAPLFPAGQVTDLAPVLDPIVHRAIIERVSGMAYGEYLRQHLFDPLGLSDTGYALTYPPSLPQGYAKENGELVPVRPIHPSLTYSAGGIVSTARDLLTWQEALARGRVVGPDAYQQMIKPTALTSGVEVPYGFGLGVGRSACSNGIDHNGRILGYESHLAYCPDDALGLVLLLNSNPADPDAIEKLAGRLVSALVNHVD